ncbi:MAG: hypothetical protein GY941_14650 [Planctomycetes bacterium]|nr:hypothetical protein [Planctomycetota bacterium]
MVERKRLGYRSGTKQVDRLFCISTFYVRNVIAMKHGQILTCIDEIYEKMVLQIDPACLVFPDKLEIEPLTKSKTDNDGASISVSKSVAVALPNKIFLKQSWGGFKGARNDLIIQGYSILVEAKNKIPNNIISNSIPHIVILSDNQKLKHKIEIMIWQQLFEKGDVFLGRRACLHHKRIPPISVSNCEINVLGEEKENIDLGSYWAGYVATYAIANDKDIFEVYCSLLSTLLSDRVISFPVL